LHAVVAGVRRGKRDVGRRQRGWGVREGRGAIRDRKI